VPYPGAVLEARRVSIWRNRYELTLDGRPLARWDGRTWRTGGRFALEGRRYEVRSNVWGNRFEMTDEFGMSVAAADRVGHKRWMVEASGRSYQFHRASPWRPEQVLVAGGRPVGSVRRASMWRRDAVAELPDLPLPAQVFVLVVILTVWDSSAAAAATGA